MVSSDRPNTAENGKRWLVGAISFSLLFHLALLMIHFGSKTPPARSEGLVVSIQDLRRSKQAPATPEPVTESPTPEREIQESPLETNLADEQLSEPLVLEEAPPEAAAAAQSTPSVPAPSSTRIRAGIRANLEPTQTPRPEDPIEAAAAPELPSTTGWIDQFVGSVKPSVDQWKNADGTRESRIVTATGQVFCGRARAPTPSEMFNPSFAMNILLFRECGRVRPAPPDASDPWNRLPTGLESESS
ncbi:MAG: hypothetical protein AAGJ52_10160 [Pseudomonadota bacterium]